MKTIKNMQALVAFEHVAKSKSYSNAAKELGVSKAYVSKLVQKLEDELGQRLFNRTTRVVTMTQAGEKFYKACSTSFDHVLKIQSEIQQKSTSPTGKLKISVAGAFGEEFIAPFVFKFLKKYPKLQVELVFEERIIDLIKESYDFAIRIGKLNDSSLISKKISQRKLFICASPEYLALNGTPKQPEHLKSHNCLSSNNNWTLKINNKNQNYNVSGNYKSNNGRSLLKACLDSLGICCLPGEYVKPYLEEGRLVTIMESYVPKEIPIWLLTPTKKNISTSIKVFSQEITKAKL